MRGSSGRAWARPSIPYRWLILAMMCVTIGVQSGVRVAFSVFYVALRQEFGWSAAATAGVFSLYMLVQAVCSPIVGWVLDRYGARQLYTVAALVVGGSLWWCSTIHTLWQFYLAYGVFLALGQTALSGGTISVILARWFPDMRGRAIALADLGAALGMGLYSPWSQWLIATHGWRWAFIMLGLSVVVLLVPLNCWQRSAPAASVAPPETLPGPHAEKPPSSWTVAQALRSWPFWMIFGTLLFSNLSSQVINVHLVALLVSVEVATMTAATASGAVNLVSLGGRVACGWLTDTLGREQAYTAAMLCSMIGMGILLTITSANAAWVMVIFIGIFGLSKGSGGIVIGAKAADMFQGERLGTIFGIVSMASGLGGAIGPWAAGWVVDRTGSYTLAVLGSLLMAALAIFCMWLISARKPT